MHSADGPDWIAFSIGTAALLIAAITFIAVLQQIRIANRQLRQGAEELDIVRRDLAYQLEQMVEFRKRPRLLVKLTLKRGLSGKSIHCSIHVANVGSRTTVNYRVRVYVPQSGNLNELNKMYDSDLGPNPNFRKYALKPIAGKMYAIVEHEVLQSPLYSQDSKHLETVRLSNLDADTIVLWDADDETAHYPRKTLGAILLRPDLSIEYVALPGEIEAWVDQEREQSEATAQAEEDTGD